MFTLKWNNKKTDPAISSILEAAYFQIKKMTKGIDQLSRPHLFLLEPFPIGKEEIPADMDVSI